MKKKLKRPVLVIAKVFFPVGTKRHAWLLDIYLLIKTEGLFSIFRKAWYKVAFFVIRILGFSASEAKYMKIYADFLNETTNEGKEYVPLVETFVDKGKLPVKLLAFYLPQFHPIPENDEWWGRGFTEWTNTSKALPNFIGHYQPHLPGELGFYDLRIPDVQKRQVALARQYGIYGFAFYYYWFAGKKLLERPLEQYLADKELDFPFCLCWANENWTRRWDGAESEILIEQVHSDDEYTAFIKDISVYFNDPRYVFVEGKPLLIVYRVDILPDAAKAASIWRAESKKLGFNDIYLVAVQSFGISDPSPYGFDAAVEFPPHGLGDFLIRKDDESIVNPNFAGHFFDYLGASRTLAEKKVPDYTLFRTVMPSWDNTARRQNSGNIFINASPAAYRQWLEATIRYTVQHLPIDKNFVFINAWNEWAEGTHLEPDRRYGYAHLQATLDALRANLD